MKLKAYAYIGDDAESEITFANTAGQAKATFADIMGERFIDVKVERLPWADKYWENGKVPDEAFLAHGWSVSCYKCGKMVDIDTVALIDTRGALCKECAGKDGK